VGERDRERDSVGERAMLGKKEIKKIMKIIQNVTGTEGL
jgi:hypothetical protein